jgi:glycogen operon protein
MIALRKRHASIMRRRFLTGDVIESRGIKDISWHGAKLDTPLWDDPDTRLLAFTLAGVKENEADLHVIINMSDEKTIVELPEIKGKNWCLSVNTSEQSPYDIIRRPNQKQMMDNDNTFLVKGKSIVAFENMNAH